jgi:segregation and condensation protein A
MDYRFKLDQFEGPLDLLLHLIKKSKINIEDIFVSEITEQYLEYMEGLDELDMDKSSEFLNMAATLIYIKSRTLVPKPIDDDDLEEDPEQELIERLKAYKIFKEASLNMKGLEKQARGRHFKLPLEYPFELDDFSISGATIDKLYTAFSKVMERAIEIEEHSYKQVEIEREIVSVRERRRYIRNTLKEKGTISFDMLFEDMSSRLQIAVTFLALLELLHAGFLKAEQRENLDAIIISKV